MKSFEDVLDAYRKQVRAMTDDAVRVIGWLEKAYAVHRTTPVNSMLTNGTLAQGYDVTWGGGEYDYTSIQIVGFADTGDALYAIKKLVFDKKRMTLP